MSRGQPGCIDSLELFAPHVRSWITNSQETLCATCRSLEATTELSSLASGATQVSTHTLCKKLQCSYVMCICVQAPHDADLWLPCSCVQLLCILSSQTTSGFGLLMWLRVLLVLRHTALSALLRDFICPLADETSAGCVIG